jgi:alpha-soluble NSF attachment protein
MLKVAITGAEVCGFVEERALFNTLHLLPSLKTGDDFMAKADKKLKSFGFFGNKYEEAAELLEKAANNYKLGKVRVLRCCARVLRFAHVCSMYAAETAATHSLPRCEPASFTPSTWITTTQAWRQAADAYAALADVQAKLDAKHDAASSLVEGGKALMKVSPADAVPLLQRAVEVYTDMGRLSMAARQLREIAEATEKAGSKADSVAFYAQVR